MALVAMDTPHVVVQYGRTKHEIPLRDGATVADLKLSLAAAPGSPPANEQCLMARGKRLADTDAVEGLEKVMMIRRPPAVSAASAPAAASAACTAPFGKRKLSLCCLRTNRVARDIFRSLKDIA